MLLSGMIPLSIGEESGNRGNYRAAKDPIGTPSLLVEPDWRIRLCRLRRDTRGQAMTEYVILSAVTIAAAAWLYHPDNDIFQGIRDTWERSAILAQFPGP